MTAFRTYSQQEDAMLEKVFDSSGSGVVRVRLLREGLHGPLLDSYSGHLLHCRYANITVRRHLRSAEHFAYWASHHALAVSQWNDSLLERFSRHLHQRRCSYGHSQPLKQLTGASLFLKHLCSNGVIDSLTADPIDRPPMLVAFRHWMYEQRGTQDLTLNNYDVPIRTLLEHLGDVPERLDAQRLRQCFLKYTDGRNHSSIKNAATALRMFVRFLITEGRCPPGLEAAIPVIPHWQLSSLPRYLQPEEVERIVTSCDAATAIGKRDSAILLLLARLGLRAGDIVQLGLGDIDWKGAWLHVCGKSQRQTRLPLTQEVGDTLVAYLQFGRPKTESDRMFICCRAPFRPFASHAAVSVIVEKAMRRAGVTPPGRGAAHLLRHSVATSLLRQGASLQDIATTLRHRSIQTTQIYAKVDVSMLDQVAQPWPEVQPC
jgi:integrase/recombinase XerD